ncbi:MAG: glycine cleavage system aminomethyltransferase GcvT, partial [Deltaproteobacteria bacterium]|nr:glycine cleavage system aminomethyltransferase GcvT [Deltaproteobacteria bacterium]
MGKLNKTALNQQHVRLGANMVEFGGWEMPLHYETGIVQEHLITRKAAGLFDISHMGRFIVRGKDALDFLQHVLSNNAAALEEEEGHYTMIPNENGGVIDDAYLYRFVPDEFILVVNAANREKDFAHLEKISAGFGEVELVDRTAEMAMLSLQGPMSKDIMQALISGGHLPEPMRNCLSTAQINGSRVLISRTGYTGEPICFELFIARADAAAIWQALLDKGAKPIGLGARDTLRLEAVLPLYGHELGLDPEGREIPAFASMLARFSVSLSPLKGDFIGRAALTKQYEAFKRIVDRDYSLIADLPRIIQPIALIDKGVARAEAKVFRGDRHVGYVTSGTMVPLWQSEGVGLSTRQSEDKGRRAIGLALMDSDLVEGDQVEIDIRGKRLRAVIVPYHLRAEAPPHCWPIYYDQLRSDREEICAAEQMALNAKTLITKAIDNHIWRQQQCVNLIPSEQTASPLAHMLSITDPAGRYAEHKQVKAFKEADVFYYQGTDFIAEVENLLTCEFQRFLGCREVET